VRRLRVGAICGILLLSACSENAGGASGEVGARELTVSAAASLTDAFSDIASRFQNRHPGVRVLLNFGPSDGLANQINEGAPVDVFASASPTWMDSVASDGPGVTGRADFARNKLAIIVPADNPAGIETLEDLSNDGVKLVLAAEGVPAGDYARQILDNAGISDPTLANVVSNEEDVKAVITKVLSGDADAGIGYVTDVTPDIADQVTLVPIPDEVNVIATYPIAVVSGSQEAALAQSFVDFVLDDGRWTLSQYGFLPPAG
jgi:molybdate transport system substrate-binding protein